MINRLEIRVPVEIASNKKKLTSFISSKINMEIKNIFHIDIIKRSIDARSKKIKINLVIDIYINEHYQEKEIKILYNDAVALTGGQALDGLPTVAQMSRQLEAEGVKEIAIITDEPNKFQTPVDYF